MRRRWLWVVLVVLVVMMLVIPCSGQGIAPLSTRSLSATGNGEPTGFGDLSKWFDRHELSFSVVKSARTFESLGTGASLELKRLSEDRALWLDLCAQFEAGEKPRGFGGISTEIAGLPIPLIEKFVKSVTFGAFDCVGIGTDGRGVQAYISTKF